MPGKLCTAVAVAVALTAAGCDTAAARAPARPGVVAVAATLSVWGSIAAQLGGAHAQVVSIIRNPATDPHDYEPTPADARELVSAQVVVENGAGYDGWAHRILDAEGHDHRLVVDAADVVGAGNDANPHFWYSPSDVKRVADAVTAALIRTDPADTAYFTARRAAFDRVGSGRYDELLRNIRARFAGVPIGASESIVAPLAAALGLNLLTPPSFLRAISEGAEPSAADTATVEAQIRERRIAVYVVNSQNATPAVRAQVAAARAAGIPVTAITETLTPATATFEQWQVAQLAALAAALHQATGR